MPWHTAFQSDDLPHGQRKLCEVTGRRVAVFRRGEEVIAIENRCPHRGGPVGAGPLEGNTLTCPWHGLKFDLISGQCDDSATHCLQRLPTRVVDGAVEVEVNNDPPRAATVYRYLVRYGLPGHVGRFGSIARVDCVRGCLVLVATDRGEEVGEVLLAHEQFDKSDTRPPAGELLRILIAEEDQRAASLAQAEALRAQATALLVSQQADVILFDAELTFDEQTLILYHPGEATAALGPLAAKLAAALHVSRVQFETLATDATRKTASATPGVPSHERETEMRGPYERLKYDFRRVWECPVCHHRERTSGNITSQYCACQAKEEFLKQRPMKLIEDGPRRTDGKTLAPRPANMP